MVDWPQSLVREIAAERCILFLGSGITASCTKADGTRLKTWLQFLVAAAGLVKKGEERAMVEKLIQEKNYLLALQGIKDFVDRADYHHFLDEEFNAREVKPSKLHEVINKIDARIVITTNFDGVYEKYCGSFGGGFKTMYYNSGSLFDAIRSDTRLIIKAHGCINDVNSIIFTRAEYHQAKAKHRQFYGLLRALFMTNTVLFLGCSMTDPDVALILEEVKIEAAATKPHYALILEKEKDAIMLNDLDSTYNISVLTYGPSYNVLADELEGLLARVEAERGKGAPAMGVTT